jgi:Uma2 family endonuclease
LKRKPGPQDIALVIEVADSTLRRDRTLKRRLYAAAGIPVYWIVNLVDKQLEVYSHPSGPVKKPDYGERQIFTARDTVGVEIDGRLIAELLVKELLPYIPHRCS